MIRTEVLKAIFNRLDEYNKILYKNNESEKLNSSIICMNIITDEINERIAKGIENKSYRELLEERLNGNENGINAKSNKQN